MSGGKISRCGTPQGGVISPLLANLYMNRFLKYWRFTGRTAALSAHVVTYADDFVIVSRGYAAESLAWTEAVMKKLGLTLNEAKTSVRNARAEQFNFLGYTFGPHRHWKTGRQYLGASPSKKSVARLKGKIVLLLNRSNTAPWPEVRAQLNSLLIGWSAYFSYGARWSAYRAIDNHVLTRVRKFLRRRHKLRGRGIRQFPVELVNGSMGVHHLRFMHYRAQPKAL
jgi:RNA-directed DNA polymerase